MTVRPEPVVVLAAVAPVGFDAATAPARPPLLLLPLLPLRQPGGVGWVAGREPGQKTDPCTSLDGDLPHPSRVR